MKILITKRYLYNSLLFLLLAVLMLAWSYYINKNTIDNNVTLHELIRNDSKKENEIVYLTVTEKPYVFAESDTDITSPKYYFLMDEDYLYIGYLDYDTYQKLNVDSINENPIKISGITKKIPNDVVKIAIEAYNEELEEEFLTEENYNSYIGSICIDTVSDIVNNKLQITLGVIFIIMSIGCFSLYILKNKKINTNE